jgi:hypothetical protein
VSSTAPVLSFARKFYMLLCPKVLEVGTALARGSRLRRMRAASR